MTSNKKCCITELEIQGQENSSLAIERAKQRLLYNSNSFSFRDYWQL